MRNEIGHPALAPRVVHQVPLPDAVNAAREVLQPVVAKIVAARHQEVEFGVMAGAEESAGLLYHSAVEVDNVRTEPHRIG